jgi:hypothetical protein
MSFEKKNRILADLLLNYSDIKKDPFTEKDQKLDIYSFIQLNAMMSKIKVDIKWTTMSEYWFIVISHQNWTE